MSIDRTDWTCTEYPTIYKMSKLITRENHAVTGQRWRENDLGSTCIDPEDMSTKKRSRVLSNNSPPSATKSPTNRTPDPKARRICISDEFNVQSVVDRLAKFNVGHDVNELPGRESSVFLTPDDTPCAIKVKNHGQLRPASPDLGVSPLGEPYQPTPNVEQTTPWTVVKQARRSTDIPKFALHDDDLERGAVTKETKEDGDEATSQLIVIEQKSKSERRQSVDYEDDDTDPNIDNSHNKPDVVTLHGELEKDVSHGNVSLTKTDAEFAHSELEETIDSRESAKNDKCVSAEGILHYPTGVKEPIPDRVIGRKIGLPDCVDIIGELYKYGLQRVVFQYLSTEDLQRVCSTSKTWRQACQSDPAAWLRRQEHLKVSKDSKENPPKKTSFTRLMTPSDRGPLGTVQTMVTPSTSDYTPTVLTTRSEQYSKVVKSLYNDETLNKCPRCSSPARVSPAEERARCTGMSCHYDFCTKCHCAAHGAKKCPGLKEKAKRSEVKVGSSKSKKNLRRL